MKIGFSTFTLISNRQDSSSSSTKSTNLGAARVTTQNSERAATPSLSDDLFAKRIKKQQEAFKSLASLPSPKESSQQRAAEKVGFLRQRIEMLKAMMAFASPEHLKNIAKELKSIAGQLAGAAKLLSSNGGGGVGSIAIPSVAQVAGADPAALATGSDGSDPTNVPPEAQVASAEADAKAAEENAEKEDKEQAAEQDAAKNAEGIGNAVGLAEGDAAALLASLASITHQNDDSRSKSTGPSASEQALRGTLADAQKELREAVNELKIRLREEDKEARRELKKAEEDMAKTDRAIAISTSNALYSELGQLLPTSLNDVSVSTLSINVEV